MVSGTEWRRGWPSARECASYHCNGNITPHIFLNGGRPKCVIQFSVYQLLMETVEQIKHTSCKSVKLVIKKGSGSILMTEANIMQLFKKVSRNK